MQLLQLRRITLYSILIAEPITKGSPPFGLTPIGLTPIGLPPIGLSPFGLPPIVMVQICDHLDLFCARTPGVINKTSC